MKGAAATPNGAPLGLVVEGILDGRTNDLERLQQCTAELSRCGAGEFCCEVTGGRFTLLPRDTQVVPTGFDGPAQARFLEALQALVQAAAPGSVESNLRCRLFYADEVAETLFVVRGDRLEPVTRRRPRSPADDALCNPPSSAPRFAQRRRELLLLAPVLLVLAALFAWQSGWIERVLAARAETLRIDTGPFTTLLAPTVERAWGNYLVALRRGPGYPTTAKELTERRDRLQALTERAACELVGNGGDLFVQLLDEEDHVLAEARAALRSLLGDADGSVEVRLPGRLQAAAVRLSLSAAPKDR